MPMNNRPAFAGADRPALEIRALSHSDLSRVLEIERQGYSHPWSEAVFLDCFKDNYRLWALCKEDSLLGYAVVAYLVDEAHLLNLCVHPDSRGCGAGRYLLEHLVGQAGDDGMVQVLLEVRVTNRAAEQLYTSAGFEEIGLRPGYYPAAQGREDARVMTLPLESK
ncbi:[SSU ribosomal protein S18P]-alanine acetyltransferase [Marinobacter pelagius]|uniref:[Ribosomal protein bS18]-alanine N-acetyltransferase n=2 Tax=Marinobacter pelagius TaxID=379482 RepID=A0A366GY43_9GAMM|nr:[SSU ribosomal protein S18P]-alanine acetyltransferase [Marinobacter pelagius]